ncbi:alpha-N-acetylglucosaminidase [Streptomyces carminius]|uniref:alpha-N-acetylglucosaminidase n=1 Tax=Streptomyces carminius TaxID=2665496 RepID=UPI0018EDAC87|nr:alpha-N-acetylglucosaminidase [Streptomyces carminius]
MLGAGTVAAGLAAALGPGLGPGAAGRGRAFAAPRAPFSTEPARAALHRLLPGHAGQFHLVPLDARGGAERFRVAGAAGRLEVAGTSPAVLLTGVHWYLKEVCSAHISWAGRQLSLPATLPAPPGPLERSTTLPHRFALNDTNDGYTAPYADWPHWERLIDVLALHGCNQVLVIAGHEAVYHRLLMDFGYSDAEARRWLPAPSHQPWWLLQNLSGYGGPPSPELIGGRADLGRRITARLRELGMHPVLPGYYGTVPRGFAARVAGARTVPQGTWHGFDRPDWLDPRTTAFTEVAAAYYRHQRELLGEADHFKMDLLHEGGSAGDVPVADAARGVEAALRRARPDAVWVILGWQDNPRRELVDAVDKRRMLIVDGISDRTETVFDREADWNGTPYCFGTIPNFGGRTTLGAKTHVWNERFFAWRDKPGSALAGTAYLPEAAERDPAAFDLFAELAWREDPVDLPGWFDRYAGYRYGGDGSGGDPGASQAWRALHDTAYRHHAHLYGFAHDSLFAARPDLTATRAGQYGPTELTYDPARFDAALTGLLAVAGALRGSDAYRHDLVDIARQALANRSRVLLPQLRDAYREGDPETFRGLSALWLRLMTLADELSGTHRHFLLGPWTDAARRAAASPAEAAEAAELERTARVLVTVWGDRATADAGKLHDYANRDWHGLIGDLYLPRWRLLLDRLEAALTAGRTPEPVDWYAVEEPWTRRREEYPLRPVGDPYATAARVRDALATAPYQGTLEAALEPGVLAPGGSARLTAALTNTSGLGATGPVELSLAGLGGGSGVTAEAQGPTSLPAVPPGGRAEAGWRLTAPEGAPEEPLRRLPYTLTAAYGPAGGQRVRTVRRGALFLAGPLEPGLRTVTTNGAVFGQAGGAYAIHGGGADLWRATAEFGALYRPGALGERGAVTLRVVSQEATGPWARAGILVRNDLARAGSPGFLNLSVTPDNGVALSYDSDGDGMLDAYRRITGVRAPVLLRLRRAGTEYTGELSTDDGRSWRTVGTVRVPGAAGRQDAGPGMTAAGGGSGTVEFTGWRLD